MHKVLPFAANRLLAATLCACLPAGMALAQVSVRSVKVLSSKDAVEIEVEASDRIIPQTQVLAGPDRLVIDFPNAIPSSNLHSQSVDRGDVKDVRVSLFQSRPPVTRLVIDLKAARSYQIFPSGRTVMVRVMGDVTAESRESSPATRPGFVPASYTPRSEAVRVVNTAQAPLVVSYRDGLLAIHANKVTLSEVLYAVQQRTGADISVAAGAEQERIVAEIEPAPAPEVLARLLNGSRFNFLILNAADDPQRLDRVILSPRTDGGSMAFAPMQAQNISAASEEAIDDEAAASAPNPIAAGAPIQPPPVAATQGKVQADEATAEQ
jgi:hypothetical protein